MAQEYAVRGNREISIANESERDALIKQGYDIVNAKGALVSPGRGKTVTYEQFKTLEEENKKLKAEIKKLKKE